MSIVFELERMERLVEDLGKLRRPGKVPITRYFRKEGKEKGSPEGSLEGWEACGGETLFLD